MFRDYGWAFPLFVAALLLATVLKHQIPTPVPTPVVAAIEAQFPGASVRRVETEHDGGRRVHEVTVRHRGATFEVRVTPAGEVVEVERLIAYTELPPAVAQAVESDHPEAVVDKVEEVSRGGRVVGYEVAFVGRSRPAAKVTFDPTGRIVSE